MQRRNFLRKAAIGSAGIIAGSLLSEKTVANQTEKKFKCKITVLKKTLNQEWSREFKKKDSKMCGVFNEGQEFILDDVWSVPEGFCSWAWADMRTLIHKVNDGAMNVFVSCCTDGFRPVYFKIEKVEV